MSRKKSGAQADPRWPYPIEPAPGDLRIVQALINTGLPGHRGDVLASPRALADWLALWGLLSRGSDLAPADVEHAASVRSGLEALVRASHGPPPAPEVVEMLDRAAVAAPRRTRFDIDGSVRVEPVDAGLTGALARLFRIVALAHRDDQWRRLKLCAREGCGAAFYDFSHACSASWCSRRCGNKGSSQTYRERRKRYRARARRDRPRSG
ncbi:MAG: CGNR zinc finger domain-containing protein [bacterium]|nr:CGNR zinc finger domain-containing protein [bacterium]